MAKINETLLHTWVDGETIHGAEYNNERNLIVASLNNTQEQVDTLKADGYVTAIKLGAESVTPDKLAPGAVTPTKITKEAITQFVYDKAETNELIVSALSAGLPQSVIDAIVSGATITLDRHSLQIAGLLTDVQEVTEVSQTSSQALAQHEGNVEKHTTPVERTAWNAKETTAGAQTKATAAENNAKASSLPIAGGALTGPATANSNTSYTLKQIRNITLSTANPSGGANGDVWIKYV